MCVSEAVRRADARLPVPACPRNASVVRRGAQDYSLDLGVGSGLRPTPIAHERPSPVSSASNSRPVARVRPASTIVAPAGSSTRYRLTKSEPTHCANREPSSGHGHRGLHVVDGAAVPSAIGVNPSDSILAMAERNMERAIRRILGDELWVAPEMADVTPADVSEDRAMMIMSAQRRERSGNGDRFREAMTAG
jgi:GMC oxidoreductase